MSAELLNVGIIEIRGRVVSITLSDYLDSYPQVVDSPIFTEKFTYLHREWRLLINPNGFKAFNSEGWLGIRLYNFTDKAKFRVTGRIAGDNEEIHISTINPPDKDEVFINDKVIPKSELESRRKVLLPHGDLHFFWEIIPLEGGVNGAEGISNPASNPAKTTDSREIKEYNVGSIRVWGNNISWTLGNFCSLLQQGNRSVWSPQVSCLDKAWFLEMLPAADTEHESQGWTEIKLWNFDTVQLSRVRFGLVNKSGERVMNVNATPEKHEIIYTARKWVKVSELVSKKSDLLPGGNLKIFCQIHPLESDAVTSNEGLGLSESEIAGTEGSKSENTKSESSGHQNTDSGGNPEEPKAVATGEADCQIQELKNSIFKETSKRMKLKMEGISELLEDVKEALLTSKNCDVVIKMKDKQFQAHRFILAARSPEFSRILEDKAEDAVPTTIVIDGFDPGAFPDFLKYLYTGSVDCLAPETALELYLLAVKYRVHQLKSFCVMEMERSLSLENICDLLIFSEQHQVRELNEAATQFFLQNSEEIISTPKWKKFIERDPVTTKKLLTKLARE